LGEEDMQHLFSSRYHKFGFSMVEQKKKDLFDLKRSRFNFVQYYFDPSFDTYYDKVLSHHLTITALISFGASRNYNLEQVLIATSEFDSVPYMTKNSYLALHAIYDKLKKKLFYIDKTIFSLNMPN
jgi:hypothetical protein